MSRSLNKVTLIGNLGNDPEIRTTNNGSKVANFSLATTRQWNSASGEKQEKTEWHKCIAWNTGGKGTGLADIIERYVKKGDKLYVEGRIEYRQYEDKEKQTRYVTEINVREVLLGGGKGGSGGWRRLVRGIRGAFPSGRQGQEGRRRLRGVSRGARRRGRRPAVLRAHGGTPEKRRGGRLDSMRAAEEGCGRTGGIRGEI